MQGVMKDKHGFKMGDIFGRSVDSRVDKQKNELGRWKSRIVAIFLLFLTL